METIYRKVAVSERKPEVEKKVVGIGYGYKETSTVSMAENGYWYSHEWESECDEPEFWLEEILDFIPQTKTIETLLRMNAQLQADKEELLEALEKIMEYGSTGEDARDMKAIAESLIQKHKQ